MDRRIRALAASLLALFVVLLVAVNYVQVVAADRIAENPANAFRQLVAEYKVDRGQILANDARTVLAESRKGRGDLVYQRVYPEGRVYGDLTGYYSLYFGRSELEQSFNPYLSGDAAELLPQTLGDAILGRPKRGATIVTTLDPEVQELAIELVDDMPNGGAIFAMNPETGDVIASASNPGFDPNPISSQDAKESRAAWAELNGDPDKPLLSRASDELFPPGSTFKLVTAAAALENGFGPDSRWPNPPELDLPQSDNTVQNFGGSICPGGSQITLALAFQVSCNVTFAEVALEIGEKKLVAQARAFGFCEQAPPDPACLTEQVPFDIPWTQGRIPQPPYFKENQPLLAYSGIGQDEVKANPMQMALVASAIANDGVEMTPRLVTEIRDPQGRVVKTFDPEPWNQPISPETASELTEMMVSVVDGGTGTAATIPGIEVAGKTGTAQHAPGEDPHAWFVSFAPADAPRVAVAVIVLDGGDLGREATGGQVSAPIAKEIIEAALAN